MTETAISVGGAATRWTYKVSFVAGRLIRITDSVEVRDAADVARWIERLASEVCGASAA